MRLVVLLFGFCVAAAAIAVLAAGLGNSAAAPAAATDKAADFKLVDQDGKAVALSDFKGKVVVLEWVNPQCPFVQRHYKAGTMVNLEGRYKDKGVVWLSINSTRTYSVAENKKWADQQKLPYPMLDDHEGVVAKAYGAKTTPHMFVIDTNGQVVYQGAIDDDPPGTKKDPVNYLDKALTELLAGKPIGTPKTVPYGCTVKYKD